MENNKNISFIKKNLIMIILVGITCVFGMKSSAVLVGGIAIIVIAMFSSTIENAFYWSLFLVPNIRIFDNLGTTMIVNILLVLPLLKYLFSFGNILGKPILIGSLLLSIEAIHATLYSESIAPVFAWAMAFILCYCVTVDNKVHLSRKEATYALIVGVLFSSAVYLFSNTWFVKDIVNNIFRGYRFEAYGSDPNYFALYICLCIASIIGKERPDRFDYVLMSILMVIGFMTASKMCLLMMVFCVVYMVLFTTLKNSEKMTGNIFFIVVLCICLFYFRDLIGEFLNNLLKRAGGDNMTMNTLTSGRSDILKEYMDVLKDDAVTLCFGRGFSYHLRLTQMGVHNTYLDIILSWGLLGMIFVVLVMIFWIQAYKNRLGVERFSLIRKFSFIVLLINFLDLSCFSAGMFFYVVAYAMIQLSPNETLGYTRRNDNG